MESRLTRPEAPPRLPAACAPNCPETMMQPATAPVRAAYLYQQLAGHYAAAIRARVLRAGERMPSIPRRDCSSTRSACRPRRWPCMNWNARAGCRRARARRLLRCPARRGRAARCGGAAAAGGSVDRPAARRTLAAGVLAPSGQRSAAPVAAALGPVPRVRRQQRLTHRAGAASGGGRRAGQRGPGC